VSYAGRTRVVDLVSAVTHADSGLPPVTLVHIGEGASAPLEAHVGQSGLYEVVTDPASPMARITMTTCTSPQWEEGWLLRVRFETAGPHSRGMADALVGAVVRAVVRALRVASAWSDVLVHLSARPDEVRAEEVPGPEGEPLAIIAELPLRARFHE
jgi:hypothetical protein